jgi:DNA-binding response OmpR family regulator
MKNYILTIEEDDFFRELVVKNLEMNGFTVVESTNGRDGVEKAKEIKPDLILLDLLLPEIDGFHVLSLLKDDAETCSIPVIVLSNLDSKEDIDKAFKLGACDFLIKSQFDSDEITKKIKSCL